MSIRYFLFASSSLLHPTFRFSFLGFQTHADCDFSHEIKRCLILGRKIMTYLALFSHSINVRFFATQWNAVHQGSLSIINSQRLLTLISIESLMPSNYLILHHPLFLLLPIPPSINVSSNESALRIRWPKYWSFSLSISSSNDYSGLISFRMDWLDPLEVQGTLKSLLQCHSSKASILRHSAFFIVQL